MSGVSVESFAVYFVERMRLKREGEIKSIITTIIAAAMNPKRSVETESANQIGCDSDGPSLPLTFIECIDMLGAMARRSR